MIRVKSILFAATFVIASGSVVHAQPGRFLPRREIGEVARERARERALERREASADRVARSRAMAEARAEVRRTRIQDRRDPLAFGPRLRQERVDAMRVRRAFEADRRELLPRQRIPRMPRPPALTRRLHRLSMGD